AIDYGNPRRLLRLWQPSQCGWVNLAQSFLRSQISGEASPKATARRALASFLRIRDIRKFWGVTRGLGVCQEMELCTDEGKIVRHEAFPRPSLRRPHSRSGRQI